MLDIVQQWIFGLFLFFFSFISSDVNLKSFLIESNSLVIVGRIFVSFIAFKKGQNGDKLFTIRKGKIRSFAHFFLFFSFFLYITTSFKLFLFLLQFHAFLISLKHFFFSVVVCCFRIIMRCRPLSFGCRKQGSLKTKQQDVNKCEVMSVNGSVECLFCGETKRNKF